MKRNLWLLGLLSALVLTGTAQKKVKPWLEWSEKEAVKMLNDSPWGQTQTDTNTAEMFFSPTSGSGSRSAANAGSVTGTNDRNSQGALNQAINMNYRIRLLSARPIRQAFARRLILQNPQAEAQLKAFAEQRSADFIVVAVDYDATDRRLSGAVMQQLNTANIGMLANTTYLERKDGKRIFVKDYKAPTSDGLGAKFVFPRKLEGEDGPFIKEDSGYLRFYAEIGKEIKLNMRFKVTDLLYDGALEY